MGSLYSQTIPSHLFSAAYSFNVFSSGHPMANVLRGDAPAEAPPFSFAHPPSPRLPTANDLILSLSLQQVFGMDNMLM